MRKTVDCAVDPSFPSSAGWGHLVAWGSFQVLTDRKTLSLIVCQSRLCALWLLTAFDLRLRAIEAKYTPRKSEEDDNNKHDDNSKPKSNSTHNGSA